MSDIWDRKRHYATLSKQLDKLRDMPERVTRDDITKAASALLDASNDIDKLTKTQPHGCTCRRIEDDDRSYLVYDETCQHHRWMNEEIKKAGVHYADLARKLEKGLHTEFYIAAFQGLCAGHTEPATAEVLADRAMSFADAAIARLKK